MVEEKADEILSDSRDADVAFLVVGDPFGYIYNMSFMKYSLLTSFWVFGN